MPLVHDVVEDTARIGFTYLANMIDDLMKELEATATTEAEESTYKVINRHFLLKIPFEEKLEFMNKKLDELNLNEGQRKKVDMCIDKIKETYVAADWGLKELEVTIEKINHFPNKEREKVLDIIKEAKYSLQDPCISQVSKDIYDRTMQLLNENQLIDMVRAEKGTDGYYYLLYSGNLKEVVQNLAVKAAYSLGKIKEPTKKELDHVIWSTTDNTDIPVELSIKNVSKELSQKIIREGNKKDIVSFARVPNEDGTYNLYCDAGKQGVDRDNIYSEVQRIILYCTSTLSGEYGKIEEDRMRKYFGVSSKIDNVLDAIDDPKENALDYGYVFSVSANGNMYRPNDYIKFDRERFIIHTPNGKEQSLEKTSDYEFRHLLERNIKSGTGSKIYLSSEDINKINEKVSEAKRLLQENPSVLAIDKKLLNIEERMMEIGYGQDSKIERAALKNEKDNLNAIKNAVAYAKSDGKKLTEDHLREGLIGIELTSRVPYVLCNDEKLVMQTEASNRFFKWCLNDFQKNGTLDLYNNFPVPKTVGSGKEYSSYDTQKILDKIDEYKLEDYSTFLMNSAVPDNGNEDTFTIDKARAEYKYLQNNLNDIKADMSKMINEISFTMEQIVEPPEVEMGIDKHDSIQNKITADKAQQKANSLLNEMKKDDINFTNKETRNERKATERETDIVL